VSAFIPYTKVQITGITDGTVYDSTVSPDSANFLRTVEETMKRNSNKGSRTLEILLDNPSGTYNAQIAPNANIGFWCGEDASASTKKFTGVIQQVIYGFSKDKTPYMKLSCTDKTIGFADTWIQNQTITPAGSARGTWSGQYHTFTNYEHVVNWILDTAKANPYKVGSQFVTATGSALAANIRYNYKPTLSVLRELANTQSWALYVDVNDQLHFEPKGQETTGSRLSILTNVESIVFEHSVEDEKNRVQVVAGRTTSSGTMITNSYIPVGTVSREKILLIRDFSIAPAAPGANNAAQIVNAKAMALERAKVEYEKRASRKDYSLKLNQYVNVNPAQFVYVYAPYVGLSGASAADVAVQSGTKMLITEMEEYFRHDSPYSANVTVVTEGTRIG
jgi:hypothetical protein